MQPFALDPSSCRIPEPARIEKVIFENFSQHFTGALVYLRYPGMVVDILIQKFPERAIGLCQFVTISNENRIIPNILSRLNFHRDDLLRAGHNHVPHLTINDVANDELVQIRLTQMGITCTHRIGRHFPDIDFFKLTLSGGNYTFDVLQNPPPAELNFSFAGAPSGSNLFMTFGDPNSAQIVVIGHDPLNQSQGGNITTKDVLNISQAGSTTSFGVNGNQINPAEGAFITYVTGTNPNFLVPNLDQNEADVEANIAFQNVFNTTSASFTVNQTNPGIGPVTVKISAFTTAAEPWLPPGLHLDRFEGAGEVQTPLLGEVAVRLRVGDRVYMRHAKAGELCERFDALHLVEGDRIVDLVPTYRGEGKTFL